MSLLLNSVLAAGMQKKGKVAVLHKTLLAKIGGGSDWVHEPEFADLDARFLFSFSFFFLC